MSPRKSALEFHIETIGGCPCMFSFSYEDSICIIQSFSAEIIISIYISTINIVWEMI